MHLILSLPKPVLSGAIAAVEGDYFILFKLKAEHR
jgi:hypothetical protein